MTTDATRAMLSCPVCGNAARQSRAGVCATCGTDLSILTKLQRTRELVAAAPEQAPSPTPTSWWTGTKWALAGAVIGIGIAMGMRAPAIDPSAATAAAVPPPPAPAPTPSSREPHAAELNALAARLAALDALTVEQSGGVVAVAPKNSLFASGSAGLGARERQWVNRIASHLAMERGPLRIQVRGHTDGTTIRAGASWASNWALGLDRARAVALALGANGGSTAAHTIEVSSAGDEPVKVAMPPTIRRAVVILITPQTTPIVDRVP